MSKRIRQACASCGHSFGADESFLGKTVKCPQCAAHVKVGSAHPLDAASSSPAMPVAPAAPKPPANKPPAKNVSAPVAAKPSVASAPPAIVSKPPAAKPASASHSSSSVFPAIQPAGSSVSISTAGTGKPKPAASKPGVTMPTIAAAVGDSPSVVIATAQPRASTGASSSTSRGSSPRRKSNPMATYAIIGMVAVAAVFILGTTAGIALLSSGSDDTEVAAAEDDEAEGNDFENEVVASNVSVDSARPSRGEPSLGRPGEGASGLGGRGEIGIFVLDLSDRERQEVEIEINGKKEEVPEIGPVAFTLALGTHQLTLKRPGYDAITHSFQLDGKNSPAFRAQWQREGSTVAANFPKPGVGAAQDIQGFDDWMQDFEQAKRLAASEKKDILIAFNGSDWCGWCIRLMYEVYFQPDFRRRIGDDFVLVHIDSPRKAEHLARVQNRQRNAQMVERFDVDGFPTVIFTDSEGQVYGSGGYVAGGPDGFMQQVAQMQAAKAERDELLAKVEGAAGANRVKEAEKALEWLREHGLVQFYGPTLGRWLEMARQQDPTNANGQLEVFFEYDLLAKLTGISREDKRQLQPILESLQKFNNEYEFQDGDRGARLNLIAASLLAVAEDLEQALVYAEAGLACEPEDRELRARLEMTVRALKHSDVLGSGTGFVVAEGGYILTNQHVIDGDGKIFVRVAVNDKETKEIPAKLLAQDKKKDMALIKVDDPLVAKLQPLAISTNKVGRGAPVGAFGYPLGDAVGSQLKIATGVVSSLSDPANEGMMLLDCRVNPGNSGGPLCNTQGGVIGVVTAKSGSGDGVESYGMAQPCDVIIPFLQKYLAGYQPPAVSAAEAMRWDEVDAKVSSSILMIVMKKK